MLVLSVVAGCSRGPRWFSGSFDGALSAAGKRGALLMVDFTADW